MAKPKQNRTKKNIAKNIGRYKNFLKNELFKKYLFN